MASQARLGRPTGPRPGFSRDDVVDAALEIGIAEFTLTATAKQMGVAVSGLYRTISSREDLLAACLERIAAQIEVPRPGKRWPDTVRAHAEAVWEMLERYPGLAGVIMGVPWAHQLFAAPVAQACQALIEGGLEADEAGVVLDFVGDTVISTHAQIEVMRSPAGRPELPAPLPGHESGESASGTGRGGATGLEETSRFAAAVGNPPLPEALTPNESWLERGGLDRKIEIIIRGVAAGLSPSATDTGGQSASGGDVSGQR
ncbi:transcriptional regulator [Actinomyces sp. HMSC075C01]|uniref:TetR family transcriptional regulator n=1 Tax=Actinomyces oris TaxID=544580 RepID=A0A1Q8VUN7_9ACTO|nr:MULTISPECIES: TetR/AcrR family transcriptional regulator [Actinomyces]OFR49538.1 transcriptional regulator [Actinomyces sp. HMSC075C01]OLO51803.1 TetR family transcriptional regulator [Actinomyces oris]